MTTTTVDTLNTLVAVQEKRVIALQGLAVQLPEGSRERRLAELLAIAERQVIGSTTALWEEICSRQAWLAYSVVLYELVRQEERLVAVECLLEVPCEGHLDKGVCV